MKRMSKCDWNDISNDIERLICSNFYSRVEMLYLIGLGKGWRDKKNAYEC
jgi:hypothetical protein